MLLLAATSHADATHALYRVIASASARFYVGHHSIHGS